MKLEEFCVLQDKVEILETEMDHYKKLIQSIVEQIGHVQANLKKIQEIILQVPRDNVLAVKFTHIFNELQKQQEEIKEIRELMADGRKAEPVQ